MPSHVDPAIYVSANMGDIRVTAKAVAALGVKRAAAVGHLVMFWGKAAQFALNGRVAGLSDDTIESWAGWDGRRGRFAKWLRDEHLDQDGRPSEWDEWAGKLAASREQSRLKKREQRAKGKDSPGDTSKDKNGDSVGDDTGDSPSRRPGDSRERAGSESTENRVQPKTPTTTAREAFLSLVPTRRERWIAQFNAWEQGLGTPSGKPFQPEHIDAGLLEYLTSVKDPDFKVRHVIRFVEGLGNRKPHEARFSPGVAAAASGDYAAELWRLVNEMSLHTLGFDEREAKIAKWVELGMLPDERAFRQAWGMLHVSAAQLAKGARDDAGTVIAIRAKLATGKQELWQPHLAHHPHPWLDWPDGGAKAAEVAA